MSDRIGDSNQKTRKATMPDNGDFFGLIPHIEEFFTKIHAVGFFETVRWENIIWFAGIVNPCLMIPQLYRIWRTGIVAGISLITFTILFLIQGAFTIHGIYLKDLPLFLSTGAAATTTLIASISVVYFRWFRK